MQRSQFHGFHEFVKHSGETSNSDYLTVPTYLGTPTLPTLSGSPAFPTASQRDQSEPS